MPRGTNLTPMNPSGGQASDGICSNYYSAYRDQGYAQNKILDYCTAFDLKKQYVKQHTGISDSRHMTSLHACLMRKCT